MSWWLSRSKPFRLAALALVPLLLALEATAFRVPVRALYDGSEVRWRVGSTEVRAPLVGWKAKGLRMAASVSLYPMGLDGLTITASGATLLELGRKRPFAFNRPPIFPLGDWTLDNAPPEQTVLSVEMTLPAS